MAMILAHVTYVIPVSDTMMLPHERDRPCHFQEKIVSLDTQPLHSLAGNTDNSMRAYIYNAQWGAEHDTEERLLLAECLIRDGVHGRKIKFRSGVESMKWYLLLHSPWYRFMVTVVICIQ